MVAPGPDGYAAIMTTTGAPLTALVLNCTLKPSPEASNTQQLMDNAIA